MQQFELGQRVVAWAQVKTEYADDNTYFAGRVVCPAEPAQPFDTWMCIHRPQPSGFTKVKDTELKCLYYKKFGGYRVGVVVGKCRKATGYYSGGRCYTKWSYTLDCPVEVYEAPSLVQDRQHAVYEVQTGPNPQDRIFVRPQDMEAVEEGRDDADL